MHLRVVRAGRLPERRPGAVGRQGRPAGTPRPRAALRNGAVRGSLSGHGGRPAPRPPHAAPPSQAGPHVPVRGIFAGAEAVRAGPGREARATTTAPFHPNPPEGEPR